MTVTTAAGEPCLPRPWLVPCGLKLQPGVIDYTALHQGTAAQSGIDWGGVVLFRLVTTAQHRTNVFNHVLLNDSCYHAAKYDVILLLDV